MDAHRLLPEYPRTRHLPHKANPKRDDLVVTPDECQVIFTTTTSVESKEDGSSTGMSVLHGQPLVRNRSHVLNKAFTTRRTSAQIQYAPIFNWWYEHRDAFARLQEFGPFSVYGDWMYMAHGMIYDSLPDLFLAYDIYDWEEFRFLDPNRSRLVLDACGFASAPILYYGPVKSYEQLEALANGPSTFCTDQKREGVYLKVTDGNFVTHRFKMVREGFEQGKHLDRAKMTRNKLVRGDRR